MSEIITHCGFRCDLCLAYRENIRGKDDQQRVSDGLLKYYGFSVDPEKIICDGCHSSKENAIRLDSDCPVRPCSLSRGFSNCSQCDEYPCDKLKSRAEGYLAIIEKFKGEIPEDDYLVFIRPYEGIKNLDFLRKKN